MKHYITLPNGRQCSLAVYVACWRQLQSIPPSCLVTGFDYHQQCPGEILAEIQRGIRERINRHIPWFGHGRKWSYVWQTETARAARALNTPQLVIHWLPSWLKSRFSHRLSNSND